MQKLKRRANGSVAGKAQELWALTTPNSSFFSGGEFYATTTRTRKAAPYPKESEHLFSPYRPFGCSWPASFPPLLRDGFSHRLH
jgi:hypothetical protein